MKWLRKKQNPSSSSSSSLNVFPLSWATRFRQLRQNPTKDMQNQHSSSEHEAATKNVPFGVPRVKTAMKEDLSYHGNHHNTHQRIRQTQKEETRSSVRVSSPRTPSRRETCKIRPLESMKKKKKTKERFSEGVESFAVVKRSLDPERDFQDSMMEMIVERGIRKPEEMEELLACYLTLNSDEYHDLIIRVFRQVWKELDMMRELSRRLKEMNIVFED